MYGGAVLHRHTFSTEIPLASIEQMFYTLIIDKGRAQKQNIRSKV